MGFKYQTPFIHIFIVFHFVGVLSASRVLITQRPAQINLDTAGCSFQEYAALGDSYAAGINADPDGQLPNCTMPIDPTSPNCTTPTCAKNEGAYSWQLHDKNKGTILDYKFSACSGAKTSDCQVLQVPLLNPSTDLISLNIGGNNGDMFGSVVTRCVYIPFQPGCSAALANAQNTIANIVPDLVSLLQEINIRAPNALIYLLSYVQFWPAVDVPDQCQSVPLERPLADQKRQMNSLVVQLNGQLQAAVSQVKGAQFINVDPLFEGHRFCDTGEPYMQYRLFKQGNEDDSDPPDDSIGDPNSDVFNFGVFHPTFDGQQQYMDALASEIGC